MRTMPQRPKGGVSLIQLLAAVIIAAVIITVIALSVIRGPYGGYDNCRSVWTTDSEWVTVCE